MGPRERAMPRRCPDCNKILWNKRSHAKFCNSVCRVRYHRANKKEGS